MSIFCLCENLKLQRKIQMLLQLTLSVCRQQIRHTAHKVTCLSYMLATVASVLASVSLVSVWSKHGMQYRWYNGILFLQYTVSQEKQVTKLLCTSSPNINQFSQLLFFPHYTSIPRFYGRLILKTQKTTFTAKPSYSNMAMRFRCDGIFNDRFIAN